MNKKFLLLAVLVLLFCKTGSSQTKLLDSNVKWSTGTLTLFISDSGNVSSVEASLGTTLGASDVYHQTWNVGSGVTASGDQLLANLSGVTPGTYYLGLKVTLTNSTTEEMEYQTPAQ